MKLLAELHGALVFDRRTRVLSERLAALLPADAKVLDVGCGSGLIDRLIAERRQDVTITDSFIRSFDAVESKIAFRRNLLGPG